MKKEDVDKLKVLLKNTKVKETMKDVQSRCRMNQIVLDIESPKYSNNTYSREYNLDCSCDGFTLLHYGCKCNYKKIKNLLEKE